MELKLAPCDRDQSAMKLEYDLRHHHGLHQLKLLTTKDHECFKGPKKC